jgi:hypothetical protein
VGLLNDIVNEIRSQHRPTRTDRWILEQKAIPILQDRHPDTYSRRTRGAILKAYDEEVRLTALLPDQCIAHLVRWGDSPDEARKRLKGMIDDAGAVRAPWWHELLIEFDVQLWWSGREKLRQVEITREECRRNPKYWRRPRSRRPRRGDAMAAKIIALMREDPRRFWSPQKLAHRFRHSIRATSDLMAGMRYHEMIEEVGHGLYGLPGSGNYMSASRAIVVHLIAIGPPHEATPPALERAIKRSKQATWTAIHTLENNGVLVRLRTGKGRLYAGLVALSATALKAIKCRETLRDGRGGVLWKPPEQPNEPG